MARIAILGAGLAGTIAAFQLRQELEQNHEVAIINNGRMFKFVPSNPWVAVGWRDREAVEIDLEPIFRARKIAFHPQGALKVHPSGRRIELSDGSSILYDYLLIATGPDLAFDEIEGFGPSALTQSICVLEHALQTKNAVEGLIEKPGPVVVGAVQGASCFGPAYEFAFILDKALRDAKVRDRVPMTFVTSEPYIGHLGLDGVGDTKGLLESKLRDRHIKWICNARIEKIGASAVYATELHHDGSVKHQHELASSLTMLLPAFRGVAAVRGIEGLTNARGFVTIDKYQRSPAFPEIFAAGVCVAIAPMGQTAVAVGVPKTGFMIESMVSAAVRNISRSVKGNPPDAEATWNAVCLADFGDSGVAFVAQPQIPPRNVNWSSSGAWVHLAKVGFEKYYLRKMRSGNGEPFYEKLALHALGIEKLKGIKVDIPEHADG